MLEGDRGGSERDGPCDDDPHAPPAEPTRGRSATPPGRHGSESVPATGIRPDELTSLARPAERRADLADAGVQRAKDVDLRMVRPKRLVQLLTRYELPGAADEGQQQPDGLGPERNALAVLAQLERAGIDLETTEVHVGRSVTGDQARRLRDQESIPPVGCVGSRTSFGLDTGCREVIVCAMPLVSRAFILAGLLHLLAALGFGAHAVARVRYGGLVGRIHIAPDAR